MTRILVCEDEENLRKIYTDFFGGHGFEVVVAADGEEGLAKMHESSPDIVLLDMRMPKMDGYATLKKIRETHRSLPVIIVTAYGYICQVIQMMNLGISGYVTKPIDYDRLLEKVRDVLAVQSAAERS